MVEFILALLLFNSNTTLVKVKSTIFLSKRDEQIDSNTTLVKVKLKYQYQISAGF